jgi:hypothetical protein
MNRAVRLAGFTVLCVVELALLMLGWAFVAQLVVKHGPADLAQFVRTDVFAVLSLFASMVLVLRPLFIQIELAARE